MTEDAVFIQIIQAAAQIAETTLRDPDAANIFENPLFDDGTKEGKRISVGIAKIEDNILRHPEGSTEREKAIRALGHFIRQVLDQPRS